MIVKILTTWEHQIQFSCDMNNEELSKRNRPTQPKHRTHQSQQGQLAKVPKHRIRSLGIRQQRQAVHGRHGSDEEPAQPVRARGSRLYYVVLRGAEHTPVAEDGDMGEGLRQEARDAEAKDGAEHVGREYEARLETEVDVGGADEGPEDEAQDDAADRERVGFFLDGGAL